ncbi:MAG: T9SS type A sorting domain-containing protein [Bacteroidota bacterium]|nr:T9SS type A sorting domain-containing protein [Bacteroidota bacterium]MDP4232244.1 T9SS type A sorting domain-containing protein [Bacteroidota bacterium]MDP4243577.1 T9SS type A sorting domain-containing protein [Bacteroidota bacterium]MDP4289112.1 T9SS type A sorting domain-containing protein [Bacteroidota bacterium]
MSKVRATLLSVILLASVGFATSQDALAQWSGKITAPFNITCVKFLQAENAREPSPLPMATFHHGLVGGPQGIQYCNSTGAWTVATVPTNWTDGWISDFSFEDTLTGYASIYGAAPTFYSLPLVSAVLKTTDGGATWNFLTNAPPEVRGLFYNWNNQRLYCSSGGIDDIGTSGMTGAFVSTNHGTDWSLINVTKPPNPAENLAAWCYYTGFASWNGTDIVLATEGGPVNPCVGASPLDPFSDPKWLASHDGGVTWQQIPMNVSSMQPVALKGTKAFFASTNYQRTVPQQSSIYTSSDNGNTWRANSGFLQTTDELTETMGGDPCCIVAADNSGNGIIYSIDDGGTWQPMSGGPLTPLELRFYVGSDSIWAFDGTRLLQSAQRPTPHPIHIYPNAVNFAHSGCFTSDTVIQLFGCNCGNATLLFDSIQHISGVAADTSKFAVGSNSSGAMWPGPPLPHAFCGPDQAHIQYTPNGPNPDTVIAHLIIQNNGATIDTPIQVIGNGAPATYTANFSTQKAVVIYGKSCQQVDTDLILYNTTCSDLTIQSITTPQIDGAFSVTLPSGQLLLPGHGGSQAIHIHALATKPNTFNLQITVHVNGLPDKTFYITYEDTGSIIPPYTRGFVLRDTFDCVRHALNDTAVYYFDTTCLPVNISNIQLANQNDPNFRIDLPQLPDTVYPPPPPPGHQSVLKLKVHLLSTKPGTYRDTIMWIDTMSDGTGIMSRTPIEYTILQPITLKPAGPTNIPFGCISPCNRDTIFFPIKIANPCDFGVRVSGYSENITLGGYSVIRHPVVGDSLLPGAKDTIIVVWPFGATQNPANGSVTVTYRHGSDSSVVQYTFSGTACPSVNASITPFSNTLGNIRLGCDSVDVWDSIQNTGCNAIEKIASINFLSGRAILVSPQVGDILKPDTTIPLHLRFVPQPGETGQICGTISLFITSATPPVFGVNDTITWCANVIPAQKSATISSIQKQDSIPCGSTWDTTICIVNTASCGAPLKIDSAVQSSAHLTVSGSFPAMIPPGGTFCFTAHFAPPTPTQTAGLISGQINVFGDTSFTVPYNIPYQPCSTGTALRIDTAGKTDVSTLRCIVLLDTMSITVLSGSATFNTATLNPAGGGYSLTVLPPGTGQVVNTGETLKFVVSFNPDLAAGGGTTSVVITYTKQDGSPGTPITIPIQTNVTGSHYNVQLALSSPDGALISPHSSATNAIKRFVITAQGSQIPSSVGVTDFKIDLKYNTNLLTLAGIAPGSNWKNGSGQPVDGSNDSLVFVMQPTAPINPGDVIATVSMTAAIPDTDKTSVSIGPASFNPNDVNFARCTASALSNGDQIPVQLELNCNDSIILKSNQGNLSTVTNIQVIPNPAHKSGDGSATLQFTSLVNADATVDLLDLSGKQVAQLAHGTMPKGDHTLPIPTATLAEGTYFARIQIGGFTVVRKFVIEKE